MSEPGVRVSLRCRWGMHTLRNLPANVWRRNERGDLIVSYCIRCKLGSANEATRPR